jgi:hypothetical protein
VSFLVSQKNYGWRNKQQHFDEIKGFLSLQLKMRLELGFGLRLTNKTTLYFLTFSMQIDLR